MHAAAAAIESRLTHHVGPEVFTPSEVDGLPRAVRRHLLQAITPGTPLALSVRLEMRGRIKVGTWIPFHAHEVLAPHEGFVWEARAAGLISGADYYVDGAGDMEWRIGHHTVLHGAGPDHARSAAGRAGAEALWVPTALLPRFGVRWTAEDARRVTAHYEVGETPIDAQYELDADGRIMTMVFQRWGDPDGTGTCAWHPFGGIVTGYSRFGGVHIPSAGRMGWFFGTADWGRGEFFRYEITALELVV